MASWSGKSKGGKLGYQFFIFLIKNTSIKINYFFIRFVAVYFLLFSDKKPIKFYFSEILGKNKLQTIIGIYKNYCLLGETLVDKIAVLAGLKDRFSFDFVGEEYLRKMVDNNTGGLLVGAHMGNYELAGQILERIDVKINLVMYAAEHEQIKRLIDKETVNNKVDVIPINEDHSHLFKIKEAFERKELVVMHGDRFLPGTNTTPINFFNKEALFPTGPLYLASKHKVPVTFVYTLKSKSFSTHYHFYATEGKVNPYPSNLKKRKEDLQNMVKDYASMTESVLRKYPLQWFNYYPFWEEEKK